MRRPRAHRGSSSHWVVPAALGVIVALAVQVLAPLWHRHDAPLVSASVVGAHASADPHQPDQATGRGTDTSAVRPLARAHRCTHTPRHADRSPGAPDGKDGQRPGSDPTGPEPTAPSHDHDCDVCQLLALSRPAMLPVDPVVLVVRCSPPTLALVARDREVGVTVPRELLARGPPMA